MNGTLQSITLAKLAIGFVPALAVVWILFRWSREGKTGLYALARMALQLVMVGYVLTFIFEADRVGIVLAVLSVMLVAAGWIALRPIKQRRRHLLPKVLVSLAFGSSITLVFVTQGVLSLDPWFWPRYLVPLSGMALANAMNAVSLAAERYESEMSRNVSFREARSTALRTSLIPLVNSLLAAGLVSFPGMMTGQILSGVSPLLAARYQIVVMCMVFSSAGLAVACYLWIMGRSAVPQTTEV